MTECCCEPNWLQRELDSVKREVKNWPVWLKREAGLSYERCPYLYDIDGDRVTRNYCSRACVAGCVWKKEQEATLSYDEKTLLLSLINKKFDTKSEALVVQSVLTKIGIQTKLICDYHLREPWLLYGDY